MSYVDGKYIPDPFKPRRSTQDRMSTTKLKAVAQHREFHSKMDDLMQAVFGEPKGSMRTVHNRTLASK